LEFITKDVQKFKEDSYSKQMQIRKKHHEELEIRQRQIEEKRDQKRREKVTIFYSTLLTSAANFAYKAASYFSYMMS